MIARAAWSGAKEGFRLYGETISALVNAVVLSVIYLFGVGITWGVARLAGKRFLDVEPKRRASHWRRADGRPRSLEEHYRQF